MRENIKFNFLSSNDQIYLTDFNAGKIIEFLLWLEQRTWQDCNYSQDKLTMARVQCFCIPIQDCECTSGEAVGKNGNTELPRDSD